MKERKKKRFLVRIARMASSAPSSGSCGQRSATERSDGRASTASCEQSEAQNAATEKEPKRKTNAKHAKKHAKHARKQPNSKRQVRERSPTRFLLQRVLPPLGNCTVDIHERGTPDALKLIKTSSLASVHQRYPKLRDSRRCRSPK